MTTPEQGETRNRNEPQLLESEGYLNRAWRRLAEGLGLYLTRETGNKWWSEENRDLTPILREMNRHWDKLSLDKNTENWVKGLRDFRNISWGHQGEYNDREVLHILFTIEKLLIAVSAMEQAQEVAQMWDGLNKRIAELKSGSDKPVRQQIPSKLAKFFNQMADLWNQSVSDQQEENSRSDVSRPDNQLEEVIHTVDFPIEPNLADTENALLVNFLAVPEQGDNAIHTHFTIVGDPRRQGEYQQTIDTYTEVISRDPSNSESYLHRGCAWANLIRAEQSALNNEVFVGDTEHITDILAGGSGTIQPSNVSLEGVVFHGSIGEDPIEVDLDKAIRLNPDFTHAYYLRAYFYLEGITGGDINKCIGDLDKAIQLNPNHAEAYYRRGEAHLQIGKPDQAIEDFNTAIDLASEDTDIQSIYQSRASAYRNRGYDQTIADFTAAIAHGQEVGFHYRQRGIAYAGEGAYDLAIDDFTAAIGLISEPADVYYERGEVYEKKGELDRGIADFSTAIELKPRNIRAYERRIKIYYEQEKYDLAIADLSKSIQISPLRAGHYCLQRGVVYVRKGEYDLAIADFEKVIAIGDTTHYVSLQVKQSVREYIEQVTRMRDAVAKYDQDIEDNPGDPANWYVRGIHYLEMGAPSDYDRAVVDFSEGIKLVPENSEIWYQRGLAYYRLGDYEAAIYDYSRAIHLKPDDHIAWCERGRAHQRRGEHRSAIDNFDRSLEINRNYAKAYQLRHVSHTHIGNRDKAQDDFEMWRGLLA